MFSLGLQESYSYSISALISTLMKLFYSSVPFPQILKWGECTHYMAINLDTADGEKSIVMWQL